jgi:hypothetical protein
MSQQLHRLACSAVRLRWEFTRELIALCVVGVCVAAVVHLLLQIEFVKNSDRYATDILMRYAAQQRLRQGPTDAAPPVFFINVGETSCRDWVVSYGSSCTLGVITSRRHLQRLLKKIHESIKETIGGTTSKPLFVVIDIELAQLPRNENEQPCNREGPNKLALVCDDLLVRNTVFRLADDVPVIALRPMVIEPPGKQTDERPISGLPSGKNTDEPPIPGFSSILDADVPGRSDPAGDIPGNLWFASPIIQPNTDGVVRRVHFWDTIQLMQPRRNPNRFEPTGEPQIIAGVGLLGAAIVGSEQRPEFELFLADMQKRMPYFGLNLHWEKPWLPVAMSKLYKATLACLFTGSKPGSESCPPGQTISVGGRQYEPKIGEDRTEIDRRIRFSLPFEGKTRQLRFPYVPSMVDTVEATEFEAHPQDYSTQLKKTVVVIGGSYLASGDLRTTPLGPGMPGAMVHANAIRAFYTGELIEEGESWGVEFLLIFTAAGIGAGFHLLRKSLTTRMRTRFLISLTGILLSLFGIAIAAVSVLLVGTSWGFSYLAVGTAIGTFTPALAVAFEGLCDVRGEIKEFVTRWVDRVAPSSPSRDRMIFDAVVAITVTDEAAPMSPSSNEMTPRQGH